MVAIEETLTFLGFQLLIAWANTGMSSSNRSITRMLEMLSATLNTLLAALGWTLSSKPETNVEPNCSVLNT